MSNALLKERTGESPLQEPQTEERTLITGILPIYEDEVPEEKFVRGRCPECGDYLVSNLYQTGQSGFLIRWECWGSLKRDPRCHYFHVL